MVSDFLIYGLRDPRTDLVRYIGQTSHGMARPRMHNEPGRNTKDRNGHKRAWIAGLHRAGGRVEIDVLEEFRSAEDLNDAECFWISQAHGLGWPLTNLTAGGGGQRGFKMSSLSITRRQMARAINSGRWPIAKPKCALCVRRAPVTATTRAKMRAAKIGTTQPLVVREKHSAALKGKSKSAAHIAALPHGLAHHHFRADVDSTEILRLHHAGLGIRTIARELGLSRQLVRGRIGATA
jgi:hypothetical protein